jgi:hypothetical protein
VTEACAHPKTKRVVVRNPMEVWYDQICCACGARVPWPKGTVAVDAGDVALVVSMRVGAPPAGAP